MRIWRLLFTACLVAGGTALPVSGLCDTARLYGGMLEMIKSSGKACGGYPQRLPVILVVRGADSGVSGYFGGDGITTGQFAGNDLQQLTVTYPYHDEFRAKGHALSLHLGDDTATAELRDRHIDDTVDDCNFDLARMTLRRLEGDAAADARLTALETQYNAQLTRSNALALARNGNYAEALPNYETALKLADAAYGAGSPQLDPYLTGLANAYVRLGRHDEFTRLYDSRIGDIKDDAVKAIFSGYRARLLLQSGHRALRKEDYAVALETFQKAYKLNPLDKDAISGIMSTYVRSGRYDDAISFLTDTEKKLDSEAERKDVREATALVYFKKGTKESKNGRQAEAEAALRSAMSLDPSTPHYLIALARLRHKAGKYGEALDLLAKGLQRFKDDASRREIMDARERMQQTELILKKIRNMGG